MKSCDSYAQLELLSEEPQELLYISPSTLKAAQRKRIRLSIGHYWSRFLHYVTGNSEPMIWQKTNDQGDIFYSVYDPRSQQSMTFSSEHEIRVWLEQRYYQ